MRTLWSFVLAIVLAVPATAEMRDCTDKERRRQGISRRNPCQVKVETKRYRVWFGIMGPTGNPTALAESLSYDMNRDTRISTLLAGDPATQLGGPFVTDGAIGRTITRHYTGGIALRDATLYQYRRADVQSNNGGTLAAGAEYRIAGGLWSELSYQYGGRTRITAFTTREYLQQTSVWLSNNPRPDTWYIEVGRFAQVRKDELVMRSHHLSLNLKYDLFAEREGITLAPVVGMETVLLRSSNGSRDRTYQYDTFIPEEFVGGVAEGLAGLRHETATWDSSFTTIQRRFRPVVGLDIQVGGKGRDPNDQVGVLFLRVRYAVGGTDEMLSPDIPTPVGPFSAPYPVPNMTGVWGVSVSF